MDEYFFAENAFPYTRQANTIFHFFVNNVPIKLLFSGWRFIHCRQDQELTSGLQ